MSSSNCCFLTWIQVSQEAGQVVWYSHLFQNFSQFVVIHTVKGFCIVNRAEIDVSLELLLFRWSSRCWQFDPGSSAFSKTSLNILDYMPLILLISVKCQQHCCCCCCCSVTQSCSTLCDPMDCSKPHFTVLYDLPEIAQTHVQWGSDVIQPSHPLLSPSPLFSSFSSLSQHQGLFQWVGSSHQVGKILELQLQYQSFQWIFGTDFL